MAESRRDDIEGLKTHKPNESLNEADPGVAELVDRLIRRAIEERASDIHLDLVENGRGRVRYRIDGVLHDREPIPQDQFPAVVQRIKALGKMNLAEQRLPQDSHAVLDIGGDKHDLRVSALPVVGGERIVMRILRLKDVKLGLDTIGLSDDDLETVRRLCRLPNGIIICTGPTGSGKTTLLYSMLMEMDRDRTCVMTVEDPVEYNIPGVAQTQIQPQVGLTFARVLRAMLRQDPDVIMVGEMRDPEIMQLCVQVSLTGHFVLTTLHADTTPGAIKRILDLGIPPFLINSTQAAIIAQRLVRVLCCKCKQPIEPLSGSLPPEAVEFVRRSQGITFHGPKGCKACLGTGYRSRTAIYEILIPGERVRHAVSCVADITALRNAALADGMKPMIVNGLEKAAKGITSIEEVCRVAAFGANM